MSMRTGPFVGLKIRLLVAAIGYVCASSPAQETNILLAPFDGAPPLGENVASVVGLRIWRTLRAEPPNNRKHVSFGTGRVIWVVGQRPINSFLEAEDFAKKTGAQIGMWGKTWTFGDGVILQPFVTIIPFARHVPDGGSREAFWSVDLDLGGRKLRFAADAPHGRYQLPIVTLPANVVSDFSSALGLKIYRDTNRDYLVGVLGPNFTRLQDRGDYSQVQSGKDKGWVYLPGLGKNSTFATDFVAGIIRILRKDWSGAIESFQVCVSSAEKSLPMEVDCRLYMAFARSRLDEDPTAEVDEALKLNPYDASALKYKILTLVAKLDHARPSGASGLDAPASKPLLLELSGLYAQARIFHPENDECMASLRALLQAANLAPAE